MNPRVVFRVNAGVVLALGLALLFPLLLSFFYRDGSWPSFLAPSVVIVATGELGMWMTQSLSKRVVEYVSNRDVYLSVT